MGPKTFRAEQEEICAVGARTMPALRVFNVGRFDKVICIFFETLSLGFLGKLLRDIIADLVDRE